MILEKQEKESWGKSVGEQISKDLRTEFVGVRSFSVLGKFISNFLCIYVCYSLGVTLPLVRSYMNMIGVFYVIVFAFA